MLKRTRAWIEDRTGIGAAIKPVLEHPIPRTTGWAYVFGSATLISFVVLVATGILLATGYTPTTNDAFPSLQWITHGAVLGRQLRGIHYFAASAMIVCIGVHAVRVFLYASYKYPREVNWLMGVLLLLLTLASAFTGQLLRWDQNGIWSLGVLSEQIGRTPFVGDWLAQFLLGGRTVGGQTLSRFFAFHVFFLPALIIGAVTFHLFLVIRNGISEPPKAGRPVDPKTYKAWYKDLLEREGVPFWPDGMWRDVVFGTAVVAVIMGLAVFVGPPELTSSPPDPSIINAAPQPDWYFLWYFAALAVVPKDAATWIMLGGPILLVVLLVALPFVANRGERSPLRRPWSIAIIVGIAIIMVSLFVESASQPWVPRFDAKPLPASVVGASSGPIFRGAQLFHSEDCEFCHLIGNYGGIRGPNLTTIADRYTTDQMTIRILNGGTNMPAFASILTPGQLHDLVAFLASRHGPPPR